MPGFDSGSVLYALNVDFTGNSLTAGSAQVTSNGQLLIGSAALPNIRVGKITSPNSTMMIGYTSPNITIDVSGSHVGQTITGNTGGAISPSSGNWNTLGTGSITIAGSGSTLTTQLTGLTNHAIQVGAGTATLTQLARGSAGQVLQSGGAGADPSYSTPTYPSTSGSTGVILRSNGTNNVYTTATYPATSAANQIIYSTATNTISALTTSKGTVYLSADVTNVTGDDTDYQVAFDTVFYDSNSDFNTTTHNLVIPITGFYLIIGNVTFDSGLTGANTLARLYISIPSHAVFVAGNNPSTIVLDAGTTYAGSYIAQLNAGDLVNLHAIAGGSTKTAGLFGGNGNLQTFFSWHFIG